ncbi:MAG: CoA transferase [Dehalococcoidia bacterium]
MDLLRNRSFAVASFHVAAAYAGWLLRQLGAQVDHETALDPEAEGAFFGQGARFGTVGLPKGPGPALITDAPVTDANRSAITALAAERPVIWITPWGLDNEWEARPWSDLMLASAGGWASAVGEPGRDPLSPPGAQPQSMSALYAVVQAIIAESALWRGAGNGLTVVSMVEAVTASCIYDTVAYQFYGNVRERAGDRFSRTQPTQMTARAKDGYIGLHCALHNQWLALCRLLGHPELVSDPRFATIPERFANRRAFDADYLQPWLNSRTRWEAYHELQRARIPTSAIPSFGEALEWEHLQARGFWQTVTTPAGRAFRVPGPPIRVEAARSGSRADISIGPWEPGKVRVVDLSMGWAGPYVSHILACYGADVIKVEACQKFDWWRGSRPPGDDPTLALHERSHVFNSANRGKRGLTLNLRDPEGNALARKLIATADIVVENFISGVMEKLGLTYEALSAENPGLIMLRQPGFGSWGPDAEYAVVGPTIEGQSGLTSILGYRDGMPLQMSNALGDPISGINGAISVLAALEARSVDGRGRRIELAQIEGFMPFVAPELIAWQRGERREPDGNRRPGATPSGTFQAGDGDRWVAVEVRSDAEWARLAAAIGWGIGDPALATQAGRAAREGDVEVAFAAWVAGRTRDEAVEALARAGVTVAPVQNEPDILAFGPYDQAGFYVGYDREHVGYQLYPSLPMRGDGGRPLPPTAAPTLGQHNVEVLTRMGLNGDQIATLEAAHVIGTRPV